MKQLVITVEPDGTTTIDAQGFKGKGCADATEAIAVAITGSDRDKSDDKKKPDYYVTTGAANTIKR